MKKSILLASLLAICTVTHADEQPLRAAARTVPVPAAASPELRAAIGAAPQPDVDKARNAPQTVDEWAAAIAASDAQRAQSVQESLARHPVEVAAIELGGAAAFRLTPARLAAGNEDRLFVFLHGGAYVFGSGRSGLGEGILLAHRLGIEVLSVDYRMPPEHPFPAALDDAVAAYAAIIETHDPAAIALGGTSAGGGLALATVHKLRASGIPLPGALYLGTPWADIGKTGDTLYTNEGIDRVLVTYDGLLAAAARLYAGEHELGDPLLSPVYGDFAGFPPAILVTGTRDMFLSDVARTHRRLRAAGVTAELHVYEGMSHAGYLVSPGTPESLDIYAEVAAFIDRHLD